MLTNSPCGKNCPNRTPTCHYYDEDRKKWNCEKWGEWEKFKAKVYKRHIDSGRLEDYIGMVEMAKAKRTHYHKGKRRGQP